MECLVEGCVEIAKVKGYCCPHYRKFRLFGDPLARTNHTPNGYRIEDQVCYIFLYNKKGKIVAETLIDTEDLLRVLEHKWRTHPYEHGIYVNTTFQNKNLFLHRFLLGIPPVGKVCDHINRNPLDNRKQNLRFVTFQKNASNFGRRKKEGRSSIFKGVHWNKPTKKWIAQLQYKNKNMYFGSFLKEEDAASAYNKASLQFHGDFCGELNDV